MTGLPIDLKFHRNGFRYRICRHNSFCRFLSTIVADFLRQFRHTVFKRFYRKLLADDPGRTHDDIFRCQPQCAACDLTCFFSDLHTIWRTSIGIPAITDHSLSSSVDQMLPRHRQRCSLHLVRRIHRRCTAHGVTDDHSQVFLRAPGFNAAVHASCTKPLRAADTSINILHL